MKNIKLIIIAFIALFIIQGCGDIENTSENVVGNNLVSGTIIDDINASTMLNIVRAKLDENETNAFGYKAVKIIYNTKGQNDEDIKASGLLVIPVASAGYKAYRKSLGQKPFTISMINENHGTIFTNAKAPSVTEKNDTIPNVALAISMTSKAGFASVMPDYIGYGESNTTRQPYMLKKSSAIVSIDMIRASVKYMTDNNYLMNGQLYISGYSQGGYTAMAVAEEIQKNFSDEFNLKGVAPMAGPYNVGTLASVELDANRTMQYPAFLAFLSHSYANYYDDINLSEIVAVNATTLNSLFDAKTNLGAVINISLGLGSAQNYGFKVTKADQLFKATMINDYHNNVNNPLKVRFEQNIVNNWTPNMRMNLVHCIDDEIIPYSIATATKTKFINNGADSEKIKLTSIPTAILKQQVDDAHKFVHANCAKTAYSAAIKWFAQIRSGN